MINKVLSYILTLSILLSVLVVMPFTVQAATSGKCGSGVTWTLGDDGVLTISGSGKMNNYTNTSSYVTTAPWGTRIKDIKQVIIENGVTSIGEHAFYGCWGITKVTVADSVTHIGCHAFIGCTNLNSITIPDQVTNIGQGAFQSCYCLSHINIPNDISTIERYAFYGCTALKSIAIPEKVTTIKDKAFYNCEKMAYLSIPNSLTTIDVSAFSGCSSLSDIFFKGTKEEWKKIKIASDNEPINTATIHYNQTAPNTYYIAVLSTEKNMSIQTGKKMKLGFCLADSSTSEFDKNWKAMAIVNSDPTVAQISDYVEIESGYMVELTGLKQGITHLSITDTETGVNTNIDVRVYDKYINTYTYSATDVPTIYPDTIFARNTLTNIYDMNGIYISDYSCTPSNGGYDISFNVYNTNYYAVAVDIYDENGIWKSYEEIEKYESPTKSMWDIGSQIFYYIPSELSTNTLVTYKQSSFSKCTPVHFTLPNNCFFTISSNAFESPGVIVINSLDIAFDAMFDFVEAGVEGVDKISAFSSFKDTAKEQIIEELSKKTDTILLDTLKSDLQKAIKRVGTDYINENAHSEKICSVYATLMESTLLSGHINIKQVFKSATKMSESFVTKLGPIGAMIKAYFTTVKTYDKIMQANQMAGSANDTYATFYANISDGYIQNGVYVNTNGNIEADTVLQVFRINDSDITQPLTNNTSKKSTLYNISFVKGEESVQPSGKVQVHIAIPQGLNRDTCTIYRQEEDGTWTALDAYIEGNYLVFETNHFSLYSIVGDPEILTVVSLPEKLDYCSGDTLDTNGLVLEVNGELISDGFICNPYVLSGDTDIITVSYGDLTAEFNVTVTERILGDADGDGVITIMDATVIQRHLAAYTVANPEAVELCGDVTGDGLDIVDATCIQRYLADFTVPYSIGKPIT